jgi:hypothetical protein
MAPDKHDLADTEIADTDIAIVGIGIRAPGARDYRAFWRNLQGGVESIRSYTDEELLAAGEDPAHLRRPNYVRAGGSRTWGNPWFPHEPPPPVCALISRSWPPAGQSPAPAAARDARISAHAWEGTGQAQPVVATVVC